MSEIVVKKPKGDLRQKEDEEGPWCQLLPQELLSLISSHLLVIDPGAIAAIRLTCKSWHLIDSIPQNRIQRSPPIQKSSHEYPYLMSLVGSTCKFFHPIRNHSFDMNIPELRGVIIRFSKHSWLLLSRRDDKSVFLFNPFSKEKITLPQPPTNYSSMSFSSVPTSSNCYVVGFMWVPREIGVVKCGDEEWTSCEYSQKFYNSYCHPVIHNDRCYFLGWRGEVGVFDVKNNSFSVIGRSFDEREWMKLHRSFLLENKGELLAVFMTWEEQCVYIKGFNLKKKVWRPIQKLSNQMLFISNAASFLERTLERGAGNKIYFSKIREDNCIFYSLSTLKYHSFLGDYSNGVPYNIKEFSNCTWIIPSPAASRLQL